mgnify:FL=1
MLRVVFDTNVYGLLIIENDNEKIRDSITKDKDFLVYGAKIIRNELRDTPKNIRVGRFNARSLLLSLYDEITRGRQVEDHGLVSDLAIDFYNEYVKIGGKRSWKEMHNDFMIVAYACSNNLDVLISEDAKTMLSKRALESYKNIAVKANLRVPNFWTYKDLREKYEF